MRVAGVLTVFCVTLAALRPATSRPTDSAIPRIRMPAAKEMLHRLQSDDRQERSTAKYELSMYRDELVRGLMLVAAEPKETYERGDPRQYAVRLLADLGAREAIPIFVEHVEYKQPMPNLAVSLLDGYPCALALARFGPTSAYGVLIYLRTHSPKNVSDKAIELYALVFVAVFGTNEGGHKEGIAVIERAIARRPNENHRRLLDELKEVTKNRVTAD